MSKKGKITVKEKRQPGKQLPGDEKKSVKREELAHNKKKRYLLEEGLSLIHIWE